MEVKTELNIILAGQKKFAVDVLKVLTAIPGVKVVGFVSSKSNNIFRDYAMQMDIPEYSFEKLPEFDLGITAHCFSRIPDHILKQAPVGWIGYHPSLLPRWRGKRSVVASSGDPIVGGTVYWLNTEMDGGDILIQDWRFRDNDDPLELWVNTLAPLGIELITKSVYELKKRRFIRQIQDRRFITLS